MICFSCKFYFGYQSQIRLLIDLLFMTKNIAIDMSVTKKKTLPV